VEFVFEVIIQIFGEILLQILFEILTELGFHSLADTLRRPRNPFLSTIGFILLGAIAGAISLVIFPEAVILNPDLRKINLIVTPVAVGLIMMLVGKVRARNDQILVGLDRFGYAFIFAFAMSLVRFIWAA
jgi:hypothetical protein